MCTKGVFSVQVSKDAAVLSAWDNSVQLAHHTGTERITAGNRAVLNSVAVSTLAIEQREFSSEWAQSNLAKDAVHRKEIADLQADRLRAMAGALPTSTLYPVKRFAERVDVLLSFSAEERLKKKINQANNRLTEAAALLADGSDRDIAEDSIREYKETIDTILDSSSEEGLSQILLSQSLQDIQENTAALKPTDDAYAVKEVVLKTDSALQGDTQNQTVVADTLDAVAAELEAGNTELLQENWELIVQVAETDEVASEELYVEVLGIARALQDSEEFTESLTAEQRLVLNALAPAEEVEVAVDAVERLTIRQIKAKANRIYNLTYLYESHRGRENHLRVELLNIAGTPDEGAILRALHQQLPRKSQLSQQVKARIAQLSQR